MPKFELTPVNAVSRRASVIHDPARVEARLHALHADLHPELFRSVITSGLSARNEVTPASAPTAAGVQQWLKTVEPLRMRLGARRWLIHQQQNCPFISSPERDISIVVMTGSSETGKDGWEGPTNQAEKGAVAEQFVQQNSQLELFNREALNVARQHHKVQQVWALLYHYDKAIKEVRFELSLPTGFNKTKITHWGERLILGSIPNHPGDFVIRGDEPNAPATFQVEPKLGSFE